MIRFAALTLATLTLVACTPIKNRQDKALDLFKRVESTASGAVTEVEGLIQKGKTVTEGVSSIMDDAKRRFGQVESGVNLMMQGKEMIKGGLGD